MADILLMYVAHALEDLLHEVSNEGETQFLFLVSEFLDDFF